MKIISFFLKLAKLTLKNLREILLEFQHVYFAKSDSTFDVSIEDKRFITLNSSYWQKEPQQQKEGMLLIEGFFSHSGNNYVLRTGMLGKAIVSRKNLEAAVLFDKPAYKSQVAVLKYGSFNIKRFIYIKASFSQLLCFVKASLSTLVHWCLLKKPEDILNIQRNKVMLGDLIYDDLIKFTKGKYTISSKEPQLLKTMFYAFYFYFTYMALFKKYPIKCLVTSHIVYVQYGILARVALRMGADVVETTDLSVNHIEANDYKGKLVCPTYHFVLKTYFNHLFAKSIDKNEFIQLAEKDLQARLSGAVQQFDAQLAYKGKLLIDKETFKQKLGWSNSDKPIVIIFAHVFADAPHCSEKSLYLDYYQWLKETLRVISEIKDVLWVVKSHPSAKAYQEEGLVESLVEKWASCGANHIRLYPEEISTKNLDDIANAIVTVQGTAGLEFSCLGLPVILAGKPFYSGFGFTIEPNSIEAYEKELKDIKTLSKLSSEQVEAAKLLYGAYFSLKMSESAIISSDALDMIWGYGERAQPDIQSGNKQINDNLMLHDPKHEPQYQKILEYIK